MNTSVGTPLNDAQRASGVDAPIVVTHVDGLRFAAQVRAHRVIVDQTLRAGGADSAPTPLELLGVALGSCVALYVTQFFAARQLEHSGLEVQVEQHRSAAHNGIGAFTVHVLLPRQTSDQQLLMLERVVRTCPVHRTLEGAVTIDVQLHRQVNSSAV